MKIPPYKRSKSTLGKTSLLPPEINPKEDSGIETIEALKRGVPNAHYHFVSEFSGRIKSYLAYWVAVEDSEDIAQDIFLYLWEHRDRLEFKRVRQLSSYVYTAARTRAINMLKIERRQKELQYSYLTLSSDYSESPADIFEYDQYEEQIEKVLDKMPEQRRRAYELMHKDGYTYEMIAKEMGISQITARRHISNAISDIKKALSPIL